MVVGFIIVKKETVEDLVHPEDAHSGVQITFASLLSYMG
jgi:hypothetical protein